MGIRDEASSTVLNATKAMNRRSRQTRKDRIAAVEARQNEGGDRHYCSLDGKMLPDRANSAKLVVTGFGGLSVMKFSMDSVLSTRTPSQRRK